MRGFILIAYISTALFIFMQKVQAQDTSFKKIEVHFIDWSWVARVPYTPKSVRENAEIVINILGQESIFSFIKWLKLEDMIDFRKLDDFSLGEYGSGEALRSHIESAGGLDKLIDARLVIDIYSNGSQELDTYVSDGRWLYQLSTQKVRKIDEEFLNRFVY